MTKVEQSRNVPENRFAPPLAEHLSLDERRRPPLLWVIAGIYLLGLGLNVFTLVLMATGKTGARLQEFVQRMTLVDYVTRYYPSAIILAGVCLLIAVSRWSMVPFAALTLLGIYDLIARRPIAGGTPNDMLWLLWGPKIFMDLLPVFVLFYCWRLSSKGILR